MITRLAWIVAITLGLLAGGFGLHFPGSYGEPAWSASAAVFGYRDGRHRAPRRVAPTVTGSQVSRRTGSFDGS